MMKLGMYTHCKRCGDSFRDPGPTETADYNDGFCSVECLKAENAEKAAYQQASEGINSIIDNWDFWTPEQIKQHLFMIQGVVESARPTKKVFGTLVKA
jgi:hypothetical protein